MLHRAADLGDISLCVHCYKPPLSHSMHSLDSALHFDYIKILINAGLTFLNVTPQFN